MAADIDEKTKVPLFAVLASIPILVGGIIWLTAIYAQVVEATRINAVQDETLKDQGKILIDIQERVIRIEERVKHISKER